MTREARSGVGLSTGAAFSRHPNRAHVDVDQDADLDGREGQAVGERLRHQRISSVVPPAAQPHGPEISRAGSSVA